MKLPWVSREQHEYVKEQLTKVDAERQRLLDRLLSEPADRVRVERVVERIEDEDVTPSAEQGAQVSFSTPFDRVEKRMGEALKVGTVPQRFRARAN